MIMLAVSTSAKYPSAALLLENGEILSSTDESGKPHSVSLCALVDGLLEKANIEINSVDKFAVDVGPGSFTGVRIGVSFMNALAFSLNKGVLPVSSLAALSMKADAKDGRVFALIDARNGNGYAAIYENGACVMEPCACVQSEILMKMEPRDMLVGDCDGKTDSANAELVLKNALLNLNNEARTASAMYLRPSQAERMKTKA